MDSACVFISHTTADDHVVKQLREALVAHGLTVWDDARYLRGGDELWPEVTKAIETARSFIVIFSQQAFQSEWVFKEVQRAVEIEQQRKAAGDKSYRVIALRLDDVELGAFRWVFGEQRAIIHASTQPGGLSEAIKPILDALGEQLPEDKEAAPESPASPLAELVLKFEDPVIETATGEPLVKATATLTYEPAEPNEREIVSNRFKFAASFSPIDANELRWYLEKFVIWPAGIYEGRAKRVEEQLPKWGQALHQAIAASDSARQALTAWEQAAGKAERRFSIMTDDAPIEGATEAEQKASAEAANALLSLPWELLHDGNTFLFQGKEPARVRRRLPNRSQQKARAINLPIRILLVSPRPEDDNTPYIDHRISALPLVDALDSLGELAELTVLAPPTFKSLQEALLKADEAGHPFDVIHFDGHGVYDRHVGLGQLCFEEPNDSHKLSERAAQNVSAAELAAVLRDHRVPLVFLEACQSAQVENAGASVAAELLKGGVTSVVAMTHSVLVETARRFVTAFYRELAEGKRVGAAMLAGQRELHADNWRGRVTGAGDFRLQDWFVPVLYQEANDPRLIARRLSDQAQRLLAQRREFSLGALPAPPAHSFIGRSRALLALERMLAQTTKPELSYAVVRGRGGEGKTTLAVELVRWLVRTKRFARAAFVSLEHYTDARGALDSLGQQLLGASWQHGPMKEALQLVERALRDQATIISSQPPEGGTPNVCDEIFALCQTLLRADSRTRIVFTSREALPVPFDHAGREVKPRSLDTDEAIELVGEVLKVHGDMVQYDEQGRAPQDIMELIEAAGGHARALTKLAGEIGRRGLRQSVVDYRQLMADLESRHPGDRENSLYASIALSLRRLPPAMREPVKALAFFHGGANLAIMHHVLRVDEETALAIGRALIEVGLAEEMPYGHLRFDPALPAYLLGEWGMDAEATAAPRARWVEAMWALTSHIYQQRSKDARLSATLTLLELPNLLALLARFTAREAPEQVVELAQGLESLFANLGRPRLLAQVTSVREQATRRLTAEGGTWSHARHLTESANIDRLLERGQLSQAKAVALRMLDQCLRAGEAAFTEAAYDIAYVHWLLGRVLQMNGEHEAALPVLAESERRFAKLGAVGDADAERMVAGAIIGSGDCLRYLGRLDNAAARYEEAIKLVEKLGDQRSLVVSKLQLATLRLDQRRYAEALAGHTEARELFERLGESRGVATAWHQIAIVHRQVGQFEQAEQAYRQSLKLWVQQQDTAGEAATLLELGNLAATIGRSADAVNWYRQAANICVRLGNLMKEGSVRSNLANTLIQLQQYDEARDELRRAIECKQPFGHSASIWNTWDILHDLEQATGHADAAAETRRRALAAFLAHRRARGENHEGGGRLCAMVFQAIQQGETAEAEAILNQLSADAATPARLKPLLPKLSAILRGDDLAALAGAADDPALYYQDAVELTLLLEALDAQSKEEPNVEKG